MKLFVAVDQDVDLWPHFKAHYEQLGISEFFISSAGSSLKSEGNVHVFDCVINPARHYFDSVYEAYFKMIRANTGPQDWYALAELDEFHDYEGASMVEVAQAAERAGKDFVGGILVDRVARDGSLPELTEGPILEQFPIESRITREILKGCPQKIMLVKGHRDIGGGNHGFKGRAGKAYREDYKVFHLKWHAQVLRRMQERVLLPDDGNDWVVGNQRVLDYWEKYGSVLV